MLQLLPLSPYSKIFYYEYQLAPSRSDYNVVFNQDLQGKLNISKLGKAISKFIQDYILINSHVEEKDEELYWVKNNKIHELEYFDNELNQQEILNYVQKPFNLKNGPLYRFGLMKNKKNKNYKFIVVLHHLLIDGSTMIFFCNELTNYYNQEDYTPVLSKEEQYTAIFNLSEQLKKKIEKNNEKSFLFWRKKLLDIEPVNFEFLSTESNCYNDSPYDSKLDNIGEIAFHFNQDIIEKLNQLKSRYTFTDYKYGLSIYALLLYKYTGQKKFFINYPVAIKEGLSFIYGAHVNTNIIPYDFTKINNILEVIQQTTGFFNLTNNITSNHNYFPIYDIITKLNFDSLNNIFAQTNFKNTPFKFNNIEAIIDTRTNIDLTSNLIFEQQVENNLISYRVRYKINKINYFLLSNFINCYKRLFISILDELISLEQVGELCSINNYNLLSGKQYQQIVYNWNQTNQEYSIDKTIHQLFEEQVVKTPHNIAIIYEGIKLSYKDLDNKANQLTNYIKSKVLINPDNLIALYLNRNENMIIAMLAIMKAGGAYVPIDPTYPKERIDFIIKDTKVKLILTDIYNESNIKQIIDSTITIIVIDSDIIKRRLLSQVKDYTKSEVKSSNLAYVIYTSGTTGKPKGVMIEHRGVINLVNVQYNIFGFDSSRIKQCLWYANYVFDAHVWEVFSTIIYGNVLHILSDEVRQDLNLLRQYVELYDIDIGTIPPAILNNQDVIKLKTLIVAGEKTPKIILDFYYNNKVKIINAYGPTEATVCTNLNYYNNNSSTNIGAVLNNIKCYVLDSNLQPMPIGAIGELHIGGVSLARGYLNQPEITLEKFINNPFQTKEEEKLDKNSKIYKTGDLVKWLPNGTLEYVGRNDFQIKIRGYRIELGEIENILVSYEGVKQAAVISSKEFKDINKNAANIIGYYVASSKLDEEGILDYLRHNLPEYMIPNLLIYLEKLPLTVNGKLDWKALPKPEFNKNEVHYIPRNELEANVRVIWAEVLSLPEHKVGIKDDFFKSGGDSIIGIQLVSRLRQKLNLNLSIKDIFIYRTIEKLYDNVLKKNLISKIRIKSEQGILSGEVDLLPIQEWFFDNNFIKASHWNQAFLIKTPELETNKLEISLETLVNNHDAFKLKYKKDQNNQYIQYYDTKAKIEKLKLLDLRIFKEKKGSKKFESKLNNILTSWQSEFNLEIGPLYSIGYIYGYEDGSARVFFALHHLIIDAVSWRIIVKDLQDIYQNGHLELKKSSYRQWVKAIKQYEAKHKEEKIYWQNILINNDPKWSNTLVLDNHNSYANLELSLEHTERLLKESNKAYNTQINDLLLTALGYALAETTGYKVNNIIVEGHGREEIDDNIDITRTLGWFTTMYPIRLEVRDEIDDSIKYIKETLSQIPNKGIGYGALFGYLPETLPKIIFNYLGQFEIENTNQKNWNITSENSGISVHPLNYDNNIININGLIIDSKLQFNIASKLIEEKTNKLIHIFEQKLKEIIINCTNKDTPEHTMSDFKDFTPYVNFNTIEELDRLFIFPPAEGGAESYFNNLVPQLHNQNLTIFNNYYLHLIDKLDPIKTSNVTYEKLANEYICYIKGIQSQGPYNLLGWSFGGVLAFEIARQLSNSGDKITNLILIDSLFNYKKALIETNTVFSLIEDINYKYCPSNIFLSCDNLILFKALRLVKINNSTKFRDRDYSNEIFEYYSKRTKYNNLDTIIEENKIKLMLLDSDHFSWINDKAKIRQICDQIKSNLQ